MFVLALHGPLFLEAELGKARQAKNQEGKISPWDRATAEPRVPSETPSIDLERRAIEVLTPAIKGSP
jgi:hypothetical protein